MFEGYTAIDNSLLKGYPEMANYPNSAILQLSSDKGLCGGVNSTTAKAVKQTMKQDAAAGTPIFIVGDKGRSAMQGAHPNDIVGTVQDSWTTPTNFAQVSAIATEMNNHVGDVDGTIIFFNEFQSMIAYQNSWTYCAKLNGYSGEDTGDAMPLEEYEVEPENRGEVLENFSQYAMGCAMYSTFVENAAAFQSSQMQAMENATSNANEVIDTLTIQYNKARQTKITTELCEIVAGAAALEG